MIARRTLLAAAALCASAACVSLPPFGADLGMQEVSGTQHRPPYPALVTYWGHVMPGAEADEVVDGRKLHYVYVWVPGVTPELGVRMLSPARAWGAPKPRDFVDGTYMLNHRSDVYFDPWIRFERCLAQVNPEDIGKPCPQWSSFGENDDSAEVPEQPNGTRSNAVLRVRSSADDPLKTLVRGVYRIAYGNLKGGEVQGSFIAQVGSPNDLHGMALARTPAELAKAIGEKGSIAKDTPIAK